MADYRPNTIDPYPHEWRVDLGTRAALNMLIARVRASLADPHRPWPEDLSAFCDAVLQTLLCNPALTPADYARICRAMFDFSLLYRRPAGSIEPTLFTTLLRRLVDVLSDRKHPPAGNGHSEWMRASRSDPQIAPFIPLEIIQAAVGASPDRGRV